MAKSKKLPDNQITVYQTADGKINIEVLYANENIWLQQKRMAELFGCSAGSPQDCYGFKKFRDMKGVFQL